MYISSFTIQNFKCFKETDRIELKQGFNLFVEQNNVGKSSLLEILSLKFEAKPYKSFPINYLNESIINLKIIFDSKELIEFIKELAKEDKFYIPICTISDFGDEKVNSAMESFLKIEHPSIEIQSKGIDKDNYSNPLDYPENLSSYSNIHCYIGQFSENEDFSIRRQSTAVKYESTI